MKNLEPDQRAEIAKLIRGANGQRPIKLSIEALAEAAEQALRRAADEEQHATDAERELWRRLEITRHHVATMRNLPARPLNDPERRARLLGIVLALGIDRAAMNRWAGGL